MGMKYVLLLWLCLCLVQCTEQDEEGGQGRAQVSWYPAQRTEECLTQSGLELVQKGRPSMACKEDGEKFCFCGRRVNGRVRRERGRFLCGTCTISFKLDRTVLPEQPIKPDQPRIEGTSERTPKQEFI